MQRNTENYTPRIFFFLLRTDRNLNRVSRDNWPLAWFPIENLHVSTGTCSSRPRAVVLSFSPWQKGDGLLVGRAFSRTTSTVRSNFRDTYNWFPAAVEVEGDKVTGKDYMGGGPRFPVSGYSCITRERKIVGCWKVSKAIFRRLRMIRF